MFRTNNRGIALISVILMSALMISLYLRFIDNAGLEARIDARRDASMRARWALHGTVDYSIAMLSANESIGDAYTQRWKSLSDRSFDEPIMICGASCAFRITDESAKANINLVDEYFLTRLFESHNLGIISSFTMVDEELDLDKSARLAQYIMDYIDEDDSPRPLGVELSEYPIYGLPAPRNGPMQDIRELLRIPCIGNDIFLASGTRPGLEDLLTVYGDGKINVNTADKGIITALGGLPEGYTNEKRNEYHEKLFVSRPFLGISGFTNFISKFDWRISKEYTGKLITTTSWFRIDSIAQTGEVTRRSLAVVYRDYKNFCQVFRYSEIP